MKISYSLNNDLKSHPNKLLKDHLFNVGERCRKIVTSKKMDIDEYVDFRTFKDVAYLIGIGHDFGKATSYFQEYIRESNEEKRLKLKNKPETHHGLISAIFTYYLVKNYLENKKLLGKEYYEYLPVISFLIVKRHHGNLDNAMNEINFDKEESEALEKQVRSINFEKLKEIYDLLAPGFNCKIVKNKILHSEPVYIYGKEEFQIKDYEKDLSRKERGRIRRIDEEQSLFFYFATLILYSVLIDSDKMDAANLEETNRTSISENLVDEYKRIKFGRVDNESEKSTINCIRNAIYTEAISNIKRVNLDKEKILSLNVPTGSGKTLTALSFALKLRNRIEKEKGYKPRIIYSLPFLSIIDQNFKVFEDIFKTVERTKPTSDLLLKHHHLSDVIYEKGSNEFESVGKDPSKDLLLIEGWNSEIVVTTFIQFFYSMITNKNRAARKIHNVINSVVILDEVQTIPHKYWLLLNKMMNFFSKHFNTYFLLMTATQPLIFDGKKNEITPLIKDNKTYFTILNRVKLIKELVPISFDEFEEILKNDIAKNSNKSFLVILNTIRSSKTIYEFISNFVKSSELFYLSTNITPKERLKRIKEIIKRKDSRSVIISTQLIEAGVDVDVDIVYRDFAPLDSINQSCGRCNRNFNDKYGTVNLFVLMENKNGRTYYPYTIYESFLISKTKEVLEENSKKEIEEHEFFELNNNYFEKVNIAKSQDESNKIINAVEGLNFGDLSEFKLIGKKYLDVNVFIETDEYAKMVWEEYEKIHSINNLKERKNKFLGIKKDFYDYVISAPFCENLPPLVHGFYYVSNDELEKYYDENTGFHCGEGDFY